MPSERFTLLMQLGPSRDETRSVQGEEFVLGREPSCDWEIDDVEVSRKHARLIFQQGNYAIEDLGSTNGTYVNGQRIRSVVALEPGATVRLGENVLLFYDLAFDRSAVEDTREDVNLTNEEAPQVELIEAVEPEKATPVSEAPFSAEASAKLEAVETLEPQDIQEIQAEGARQVPFYRKPVVIWVAAIGLLGVLMLSAFFWYVDANFLWCDVFGGLITGC